MYSRRVFMGFAWTHTTYAVWKDIIFNFEWKRDLDYFLSHMDGAKRLLAIEAYKYHGEKEFVEVRASSSGANKYRKKKVQAWYDNKRNNI